MPSTVAPARALAPRTVGRSSSAIAGPRGLRAALTSLTPSVVLAATALCGATGCDKAQASEALAKVAKTASAASAPHAAPPAPGHGDGHGEREAPPHGAGSTKFAVPFAWESSPGEPLSVARRFLGESLRDNRAFSAQSVKVFAEYRDHQKPRATVVTCSDSRVHTSAFDATPENDVFMIKNIGNQIHNAEGSVEYGVEHLETPVLFVIGHTGCGAVKAALGDLSKLSKPVHSELAHLKLTKPAPGKDEKTAWADAVIENVHQQVRGAVRTFSERVQMGKLTVVGAVYDFRNDLGNGTGRLTIVDVNGNDEPERMRAFVDALGGASGPGAGSSRSGRVTTSGGSGTSAWSASELTQALRDLEARQRSAKSQGR